MEVFELGARALQKTVVEEQLEPAQERLGTAAKQGDQVRGTKKTVPVDEPENEAVAVG